jgi:general secretion pathway protein F
MPSFRFRAVGADGVPFRGELEASDCTSLAARLQAEGIVPLRIAPMETGTIRAFLTRDAFARTDLSAAMLADLIRRLATLLVGGVSVEEALAIIAEQADVPALTHLVHDLLRRLRGGAPLAEAMAENAKSFPPIVVGMVRAGEASGALPATLSRLADYLQRSEATRQTVRSALIYPAILLLTATGSVLVVLTVVLPALRPTIEESGADLPLPTQIAFGASALVQHDWWVIALTVFGLAVAVQRLLTDRAGRSRRDRVLLRLPVVGKTILQAEVARFARTLGALIGGGVSLPAALALAHPVLSNLVLAEAIAAVTTRLREGGGLAEPLARAGVFPSIAIQLVRIGEATGRLDTMLVQLADSFDEQVQRTIARSLSILVPALTIGLGAVVAGIIASVMLAVLNINELAR